MKALYSLAAALLVAFGLFGSTAQAQERCGTPALLRRFTPEQRRYLPGGDIFERNLRMARAARTEAICDSGQIVRIPVVFHIVHNGEPIGVGTNILDARLHEQIAILNQDYRRAAGTPGYNDDPRSQDAMIEFYLACVDPSGNATDGIDRINGHRAEWSQGDNDSLKALSIWPTERYLNIWVCNLTGGLLGYASFPSTDLPFGGAVVISQPEGVVATYRGVGYTGRPLTSFYTMGRTLTHEIGHFFGLIHIWGDGDCSATDYCDDTPPQNGPIEDCRQESVTNTQCPGEQPPMIRNYMGYAYDSCMHIFTHDQVYRMRYVLCNTPNRASLRTVESCFSAVKPSLMPGHIALLKNHPNATNEFQVQFNDSGLATLEVVSMDGRILGHWTYAPSPGGDVTLNLNYLGAAVYALLIRQNGRNEQMRVYIGR